LCCEGRFRNRDLKTRKQQRHGGGEIAKMQWNLCTLPSGPDPGFIMSGSCGLFNRAGNLIF
jgi:hypothetical protein